MVEEERKIGDGRDGDGGRKGKEKWNRRKKVWEEK